MKDIIGRSFNLGYMDTLAAGDSILHRLDPRAKLLTTVVFMVAVVSFDKYTVTAMLPFLFFPLFSIILAGLPVGYLLKKVLVVSPFAVMIGILNPFLDRDIVWYIGTVGISGGMISFVSIMLRFFLTVTAVLVLISVTGFNPVCLALARMGVPGAFVNQLMFLYRYLFVLTGETGQMVRAISLRSAGRRRIGLRTYLPAVGHLLLRTLDRAQRIHLAMRCRGFEGMIRVMNPLRLRSGDIIYLITGILLFAFLRFQNVPVRIGVLVLEVFR